VKKAVKKTEGKAVKAEKVGDFICLMSTVLAIATTLRPRRVEAISVGLGVLRSFYYIVESIESRTFSLSCRLLFTSFSALFTGSLLFSTMALRHTDPILTNLSGGQASQEIGAVSFFFLE